MRARSGPDRVPLRSPAVSEHPAFPTGRVRYFATAAKGELQVRGELRVLDGPGAQVIARGPYRP